MACTTCMAQYVFYDFPQPSGGKVVFAEGIVPVGKEHTLMVPKAVNKNTRLNVIGIASGALEYSLHPNGFTPVVLEAGLTHEDIPPYPAGTYAFRALEHTAFYCITAVDGVARPRGVKHVAQGEKWNIPQGTVAVLIAGSTAEGGPPEVYVARNAGMPVIAGPTGAKFVYMEGAVWPQ